jgi:hypothetical protein
MKIVSALFEVLGFVFFVLPLWCVFMVIAFVTKSDVKKAAESYEERI